MEITKTRTTPYRPCSIGQVEKYNRLLLQTIRCFLQGSQKDWDKAIQILAGAIRSMVKRSTVFSANMMMFGQEVSFPTDITFGINVEKDEGNDYPQYVKKLRESIECVHGVA